MAEAAPARVVTTPPTCLRRFLRRFADRSRPPTPEGSLPGFPWSDVTLRLNPYPPHYRAAFACSLLLYPQPHRLTLRLAFPCGRATGLPRCAVETAWVRSCLYAGGSPSAPEEFRAPDLTTTFFGQSLSAPLARPRDDACGSSPGLTLPRPPGPQLPWCWQSRPRLALRSPSRRMRIRCPEGSVPPRCQGRTPR